MLVRTPHHKPTESLLGYVLRVSETNGYETPWHVLSHAEISQGEMQSAGLPTRKLAAVLNRTPDALDEISYRGVDEAGQGEFRLLGHSLGKGLNYTPLRLRHPAICPHCIAEEGHIDAFFDLTMATACPHHRCTLVTHCPECENPLSWFRPGLLTCKCGASLAEAETSPAPTELVALMAVLWALLHRQDVSELAIGFPVRQMLGMQLRSLLLKLPDLGRWNHPNAIGSPADLAIAAAGVLADWPTGFHRFLSRVGHRSLDDKAPAAFGLRKQFDQLYTHLFKVQSCGAEFNWLRDEFVHFGLTEWGEAVVDNKLLRGNVVNRRYVTKKELARQMGVSPTTLGKWHRDGLVEMKVIPTQHQVRYVADSQAEGCKPPIPAEGEVLGIRAAAAYLGVPVSVLNHLKATGTMKINHRLPQRYCFHQADLDAFRNRLLELSTVLPTGEQVGAVDLARVLREYRFHSPDHKAGFVAAYLAGGIKSIGRIGVALEHIMFAVEAVAAYTAEVRSNAAGGALTHREAASIIRIDADVVSALQRLGYLDTVHSRESPRISRASVDAFNKQYVSLSSIATDIGSSSKRLLGLCARGDVAVLSIPRSQGSPAPFIEQKDVDSLNQLSLRFPARKPKALDENRTVAAVRLYLAELRALGDPLPRRGGKPQRQAIAKACGIDRNAFYNNPEIVRLVDNYAASE